MNTADSEASRASCWPPATSETPSIEPTSPSSTPASSSSLRGSVYAKLHELKEWKLPTAQSAVTGCIVAKEGATLGPVPMLDPWSSDRRVRRFLSRPRCSYDSRRGPLPAAGAQGISHFVRVIEGSTTTCTFCIVPKFEAASSHPVRRGDGDAASCRCRREKSGAAGQNVETTETPTQGRLAALVAPSRGSRVPSDSFMTSIRKTSTRCCSR